MVAETFTVAWRRLESVPSGEDSLPWLYGVARRCLANLRRQTLNRARLAEKLSEEGPTVGSCVTALPGEEADGVEAVRRALERMRPADREILRLAEWEELSHSQIAVALGTSVNAVDIRLHRARSRLRAQLEETP